MKCSVDVEVYLTFELVFWEVYYKMKFGKENNIFLISAYCYSCYVLKEENQI